MFTLSCWISELVFLATMRVEGNREVDLLPGLSKQIMSTIVTGRQCPSCCAGVVPLKLGTPLTIIINVVVVITTPHPTLLQLVGELEMLPGELPSTSPATKFVCVTEAFIK